MSQWKKISDEIAGALIASRDLVRDYVRTGKPPVLVYTDPQMTGLDAVVLRKVDPLSKASVYEVRTEVGE